MMAGPATRTCRDAVSVNSCDAICMRTGFRGAAAPVDHPGEGGDHGEDGHAIHRTSFGRENERELGMIGAASAWNHCSSNAL